MAFLPIRTPLQCNNNTSAADLSCSRALLRFWHKMQHLEPECCTRHLFARTGARRTFAFISLGNAAKIRRTLVRIVITIEEHTPLNSVQKAAVGRQAQHPGFLLACERTLCGLDSPFQRLFDKY